MTGGRETRPQLEVGLSAQRTRFAWRRTWLAGAAVALLRGRAALAAHGGAGRVPVTATALGCWAAMVTLAYRRGRGLGARPPQPGQRTVFAYALLTVAFAVIGVSLVLA